MRTADNETKDVIWSWGLTTIKYVLNCQSDFMISTNQEKNQKISSIMRQLANEASSRGQNPKPNCVRADIFVMTIIEWANFQLEDLQPFREDLI